MDDRRQTGLPNGDEEPIRIPDLVEIHEFNVPDKHLSESQIGILRKAVNNLNNYGLILQSRAHELLNGLNPKDPLRHQAGEIWELVDRLKKITERLELIVDKAPVPFWGTQTILVVDDEEGITKYLGATLCECGYHVLEATDGSRGLELFRECGARMDLVLTDVEMEPMNGYELARTLRDLNSDLGVIYMSGLPLDRRMIVPRSDFLKKPFPHPRAHIEMVWQILNRQ